MAEYYTVRSRGTLQILSRLDIVGRTAELARLFGIQFFDVISRGSQVGAGRRCSAGDAGRHADGFG